MATVVIIPMLLLMVWMVMQLALGFHARNLVRAAAQDASTEAARNGAGVGIADSVAREVIGDTKVLTNLSVSADALPDRVTVLVTADVVSILPFVHMTARASASSPLEAFIAEPSR